MNVRKNSTGAYSYTISNVNFQKDIDDFYPTFAKVLPANLGLETHEPYDITFENCQFEHSLIEPQGYNTVGVIVNGMHDGYKRHIQKLTFTNCHLYGRVLNEFLHYIRNAYYIKQLNLANNALAPADVVNIVESLLLNFYIQEVNLGGNNQMSSEVFDTLLYLSKYNQTIKTLTLSLIGLDEKGLDFLAQYIVNNKTLITLNLENAHLLSADLQKLLYKKLESALQINHALLNLKIDNADHGELARYLAHNRHLYNTVHADESDGCEPTPLMQTIQYAKKEGISLYNEADGNYLNRLIKKGAGDESIIATLNLMMSERHNSISIQNSKGKSAIDLMIEKPANEFILAKKDLLTSIKESEKFKETLADRVHAERNKQLSLLLNARSSLIGDARAAFLERRKGKHSGYGSIIDPSAAQTEQPTESVKTSQVEQLADGLSHLAISPATQPNSPKLNSSDQNGYMVNMEINPSEIEWGVQIGEGGFGTVFYGLYNGMEVAIKKARNRMDKEAKNDLMKELNNLSRLQHANIVQFKGAVLNPEVLIVLEYMQGSLAGILFNPNYKLNINLGLGWMIDAAKGVSYLHSKDIIHRDLKPENLLISRDGKVKITDFGLAKNNTASTTTTSIVGSICWMAPEHFTGKYYLATDTYAFGLIVYSMLTGKIPAAGKSMPEIMMHRVMLSPENPVDFNEVTQYPSLTKFVSTMWKKEPEARPTMKVVSETLVAERNIISPQQDSSTLSPKQSEHSSSLSSKQSGYVAPPESATLLSSSNVQSNNAYVNNQSNYMAPSGSFSMAQVSGAMWQQQTNPQQTSKTTVPQNDTQGLRK